MAVSMAVPWSVWVLFPEVDGTGTPRCFEKMGVHHQARKGPDVPSTLHLLIYYNLVQVRLQYMVFGMPPPGPTSPLRVSVASRVHRGSRV